MAQRGQGGQLGPAGPVALTLRQHPLYHGNHVRLDLNFGEHGGVYSKWPFDNLIFDLLFEAYEALALEGQGLEKHVV